jgi:hypothetical protein
LSGWPRIASASPSLERRADAGLVLAELKTRQSRRDLDLPAPLVDQLPSWRATQAAERLVAGAGWQDRDWQDRESLVFTTPLGTRVDPDNFRHRFAEVTRAAGLGH